MKNLATIVKYIAAAAVVLCICSCSRSKGEYQGVSGDKAAYSVFTSEGRRSSYREMLKTLSDADVIFIGETHNCPIAHWLEYEITHDIWSCDSTGLVLAAEMFERDNQDAVDAYLAKEIGSDELEEKARLWSNWWTDYEPLLFFAREHGLKFVASNVPRRYASFVKENGLAALDSLPEEDKALMAPLPVAFEGSEEDDEMFGMMLMLSGGSGKAAHYAEAQAIKDATMAWSIARSFDRKLIHYNGNYHSDNRGGIIPFLEQYLPGKKIVTVCCIRQESVGAVDEENIGRADFIVCVPETMTMTF